jgi:hypothetical protein
VSVCAILAVCSWGLLCDADKQCIGDHLTCDGQDDCTDGQDEKLDKCCKLELWNFQMLLV